MLRTRARTRTRARVRHPFIVAATALTAGAATVLALGATGAATAAESTAGAPAATGAHAARHTVEEPLLEEPLLKGSAKLKRQPGDNVHFTFDAHGFGDEARVTFYAGHHVGKRWGGPVPVRFTALLPHLAITARGGGACLKDDPGPLVPVSDLVRVAVHDPGRPATDRLGDLRGNRLEPLFKRPRQLRSRRARRRSTS